MLSDLCLLHYVIHNVWRNVQQLSLYTKRGVDPIKSNWSWVKGSIFLLWKIQWLCEWPQEACTCAGQSAQAFGSIHGTDATWCPLRPRFYNPAVNSGVRRGWVIASAPASRISRFSSAAICRPLQMTVFKALVHIINMIIGICKEQHNSGY